MTLVFPVIQLVTLLACLPAYRAARKQQDEPLWSLFLIAPALLTWIGLTLSGIGAQGPGSLLELFDLMLGSILLYYVKVFMMDRANHAPFMNNLVVVAITVTAAVLLRLFMPEMPR